MKKNSGLDDFVNLDRRHIVQEESFTYRFKLAQIGTYWYHSHGRSQEQTGMYGAIVIDPQESEKVACERDYVAMLSDWTDREPPWIFTRRMRSPDIFNYQMLGVGS